jgi:hypothetical protein
MEKLSLYQKFLIIKNEIEKHKWIESEKRGNDIGFEQALIEWMNKHRRGWSENIKQNK